MGREREKERERDRQRERLTEGGGVKKGRPRVRENHRQVSMQGRNCATGHTPQGMSSTRKHRDSTISQRSHSESYTSYSQTLRPPEHVLHKEAQTAWSTTLLH